jgi:hypothetical protein
MVAAVAEFERARETHDGPNSALWDLDALAEALTYCRATSELPPGHSAAGRGDPSGLGPADMAS